MTFSVRTAVDPEPLPNIPKLLATIDPALPVESLRTLPQQIQLNVRITPDRSPTLDRFRVACRRRA